MSILTSFLILFFGFSSFAAPVETFDRQAWLNDYTTMRQGLEGSHANLTWFASPESGVHLPELHRQTLAALNSAQNNEDAQRALENFVRGIHDGHLSRQRWLDAPPEPLIHRIVAVQRSSSPRHACAALGYVRTKGIAFSMPFEATSGFQLLSTGDSDSFRSGVAKLSATHLAGILRIQTFSPSDYPPECELAWKEMTALKKSGVCEDDCRTELELRTSKFILSTVAARIRALKKNKVEVLLIDVGGNPGGTELGDWVIRLFTDKPIHSPKMGMARNPKTGQFFSKLIQTLTKIRSAEKSKPANEALDHAIAEYQGLETLANTPLSCDMSWVWSEQRPWSPLEGKCTNLIFGSFYISGALDFLKSGQLNSQKAEQELFAPSIALPFAGTWRGPTYMLIDGRSASAAELAAAVFRDNHVGKLIGAKTIGDGCGFMYDEPGIVLSHAKLRFRVPNCTRLRADGSDEVKGVEPDIPFSFYKDESDAERSARLLALINQETLGSNRTMAPKSVQ